MYLVKIKTEIWLYAAGDPFGGPFALTKDAAEILAKQNGR